MKQHKRGSSEERHLLKLFRGTSSYLAAEKNDAVRVEKTAPQNEQQIYPMPSFLQIKIREVISRRKKFLRDIYCDTKREIELEYNESFVTPELPNIGF